MSEHPTSFRAWRCHAFGDYHDLAVETVIADLDLAFGTGSLDYDQDPPWDIADAVAAPDRINAAFIDQLMAQCADRLRLLRRRRRSIGSMTSPQRALIR